MDEHSIRLLEFNKIVSFLCRECLSTDGADYLKSQNIYTSKEEVFNNLSLAVAMRKVFESGENIPSVSFPDIKNPLRRISHGVSYLDTEELAHIGIYLESSRKLKKFIIKNTEDEKFKDILESIPELPLAEREIFKRITKKGEIKEQSIPELKSIGIRLKKIKKGVEALANDYLKNESYRSFWQTDIPTERDGRLVLPLKSNFKGKIKGIVHEVSASGATVYLEPYDIVEKNNQIREVEGEYRKKVIEILKTITLKITKNKESIMNIMKLTGFTDALMAKARYAMQYRCAPALSSPNRINLLDARHPFLGEHAVPVTVSNGEGHRLLIITGPNTGGKTVTLKTIGLLALMNQFGMEIPAAEGSEIGVFADIFADIGDEQSIEQSLSTYSAHIKNLSNIVKNVGKDALVLLDELGAGTDPEEGVAIAMALLDYFYETGALVFATTHHGILKNYGYSKRGAENASMEFDGDTLSPTFKILLGVPGESHALEIARRTGMPETILKKASDYIDEERSDISELVNSLSERQRKFATKEKEQREKERKLNEIQRKVDLHELKLRQKEMELREKGLKELKDLLHRGRKEIEKAIREIREKEITAEKSKKIREELKELEEKISDENMRLLKEKSVLFKKENKVTTGIHVKIRGTDKKGKVLRRGKANMWIVETDNMRVSLPEYELVADSGPEEQKYSEYSKDFTDYVVSHPEGNSRPVFELDIRGKRLEEALSLLERQIDRAALYGLSEFSVIHGKGGGVLQKGVHEYLKQNSTIKDFFFAPPQEGGFGKTIVKL